MAAATATATLTATAGSGGGDKTMAATMTVITAMRQQWQQLRGQRGRQRQC